MGFDELARASVENNRRLRKSIYRKFSSVKLRPPSFERMHDGSDKKRLDEADKVRRQTIAKELTYLVLTSIIISLIYLLW